MTAARKRAWFQIHLSTAMVLMIVASVLVCLNFREVVENRLEWDGGSTPNEYSWTCSGWPLHYSEWNLIRFAESFVPGGPATGFGNNWKNLAVNVAFGLAVLILIGGALELRIRRRKHVHSVLDLTA